MSDEELDFEAQLDAYMNQHVNVEDIAKSSSLSLVSELPPQKELRVAMQMPVFDMMKAKKKMDPIFKVRGAQKHEDYVRHDEDYDDEDEDMDEEDEQSINKQSGSESDSFRTDLSQSEGQQPRRVA